LAKWFDLERKLGSEAEAFATADTENADGNITADGKRKLVLLGDSIIESFRGTAFGENVARAEDIPKVFDLGLGSLPG
jgi:hypothetical protein